MSIKGAIDGEQICSSEKNIRLISDSGGDIFLKKGTVMRVASEQDSPAHDEHGREIPSSTIWVHMSSGTRIEVNREIFVNNASPDEAAT
jgi:hypothetical protein